MFVCVPEILILTNHVDFLVKQLGMQYLRGYDTEMVNKRGTLLLLQN